MVLFLFFWWKANEVAKISMNKKIPLWMDFSCIMEKNELQEKASSSRQRKNYPTAVSHHLPWEGCSAEPSVMHCWWSSVRYSTENGLRRSCVADARDFWLLTYLVLLWPQHLSRQTWRAPSLEKRHFAASFPNSPSWESVSSPLSERFPWVASKWHRYKEFPQLLCCSPSHTAFGGFMWPTVWFPLLKPKQWLLLPPKTKQDHKDS